MATVTKTWSFASDVMGMTAIGSSSIPFGWVNDGNPAGAVKFTSTLKAQTNVNQTAEVLNPTDTWETWGVPAGATVTSLAITAWQSRLVANSRLSAANFQVNVINFSGTPVHTAGPLISATLPITPTATTYSAGAAGSAVAVDATYQPSSTPVSLQLSYTETTTNQTGVSVDYRFDEITLAITYTPPSGGGTPVAMSPAAMLMGM